jgi:NAD+ kinase
MIEAVGIILNYRKKQPVLMGKQLVEKFKEKGIKVYAPQKDADALNIGGPYLTPEEGHKVHCVLTLGGDGTILRAARYFASQNIPLLGINMGTLGFLTEVEVSEIDNALEKLRAGSYWIENRMMIQAEVKRQGETIKQFSALNDFVINKGPLARLITLEIIVGEEYVTTYKADGVIISSPTGSTAYSLSAGGPIVYPELEVTILTPICPHTLGARPIVLPSYKTVQVRIVNQAESMLTIDGQNGFPLEKEDEIIIAKAEHNVKMIRIKEKRFFSVLRQKIKNENYVFYE